MATYLGFDSSTQSLTATVIEITGNQRRIVFEHVLEFDAAFPEYGTSHGVVMSGDGGRTVTAPPMMWAAALDRMAGILAASGLDLTQIRAVTGSGQQHGSVYLGGRRRRASCAGSTRNVRSSSRSTAVFSRPVSPVWMDCSTTRGMRQPDGGPRGRRGARAVDRLARLRAVHRRADPEVRVGGSARPTRGRIGFIW